MNLEEINFPTGKPHISFSEIKNWKECAYRHKLLYIDKLDVFKDSPYLHFGTAVHEGCENLIDGKTVDEKKILTEMKKSWEEAGFEKPEWYNQQPGWYKHQPVEVWETWAKNMWSDVLGFLNTEFPGWSCFNAEEYLYENIPEIKEPLMFKGFIDAVLKVPKKRGEGHVYWILDWKTAGLRGWSRDKKQDLGMTAQLILYKYFWSAKHNIPLKDIRCGFVLLKRGGKIGKICSLVPVSVGDVTLNKGVKLMKNMISGVRKGMKIKNKNSCQYCAFHKTEHCT